MQWNPNFQQRDTMFVEALHPNSNPSIWYKKKIARRLYLVLSKMSSIEDALIVVTSALMSL